MLQEDEGGVMVCLLPPMNKTRVERMDPISDLPDPIVHHIMSFLPTLDVTKISILSKRFLHLWSSFPVIDFDESTFHRSSQGTSASITDEFLDHIHNSLQLRKLDTVISEFRVKANLKGISADVRLDSAISFALENGVELLDLNFGFGEYQFPVSFASRSINVLKLAGFKLDLCKLIRDCPSLKTLSLTSCKIQRDIKISSQTLTEIKLHWCDVKSIKINAPKLHSFTFDSATEEPCRIDVLQCQKITYLSLNNVVNGGDWVEKHVCTLGTLETLVLKGCQDIESIRIRHDKLERVEIGDCSLLTSIKVIAPSLESFCYKGTDPNMVSNISFIASKSIKDLHIENANITDEWLGAEILTLCCLESLRLMACNSLNKIVVLHEKLKILEFLNCLQLEEAEIDTPQLISFVYRGNNSSPTSIKVIAPSLESLWYTGTDPDKVSNITLISLKSIKDLYIENASISDEWLEAELSTMCCLESLRVVACNSLKNIVVIHEKLQILEFLKCLNLKEAEIDTPQLVSFVYHGNMIEFSKLVTRSICNATLSINPWTKYNNESSFYGWRKLLSFFGHCKALKLIFSSQKELIIPKDLREKFVPPLYDLQCLEVQIQSLEKIGTDLVDNLLWLSPHATTLRIFSASVTSKLQTIMKFAYGLTIKGEEDKDPSCCKSKPIKCWRHNLKRLHIHTTDVSTKNGSAELQKYFLTNAMMLDSLSYHRLS